MHFCFAHKNLLFDHNQFFYSLCLNEDGRIGKNCPGKVHYRFRRFASLNKTRISMPSLSLDVCKSYGGLLDIFPNFEEDHHNFAGIEIQAKQS